jgi:hypothetical protein
MRPLRGLALWIAQLVVTYASPGSKEWAQALARELDFIEDDWSALRWAFGSVRVLFNYRPAPIRSFADLTRAAEKFAEVKRYAVNDLWLTRNLRWINLLVPALWAMIDLLRAIDPRARTCDAMIVLGLLMLAIQGFLRSGEPVVPDRDDLLATIQFYKKELKRSSSLSSIDFWVFVVASVVIGAGYTLAQTPKWSPYMGIIWLGILGLFLQMQRNNRRRLRQIEALLEEKQ